MNSKTIWRKILGGVWAVGLLSACAFGADAKDNWSKYCVRCHGEDGAGNTKMGRKLKIKNLSSPKIQTRLSDSRIKEAILEGNQTDDGEEKMPSFRGKLNDGEIDELITYVRTLAPKQS